MYFFTCILPVYFANVFACILPVYFANVFAACILPVYFANVFVLVYFTTARYHELPNRSAVIRTSTRDHALTVSVVCVVSIFFLVSAVCSKLLFFFWYLRCVVRYWCTDALYCTLMRSVTNYCTLMRSITNYCYLPCVVN